MIGITRVRNEALIIEDTLRHFLGYVDQVLLYDDCSTDNTVEIARSFDRVEVIEGDEWRADRPAEETRHRGLLLDRAPDEWVLCFDADERLEGDLPDLLADGYRFRLFDGYLTPDCSDSYVGGDLTALPRKWGPEYRDILMLFRRDHARYIGMDRREPLFNGWVETCEVRVRHYGKCLSVDHWDETCDYYADNWGEPYRSKWAARRGQAIHTRSDFGHPLYDWDDLARHGVRMPT